MVLASALAALVPGARAQTGVEPPMSWKKIAGTAVAEGLAGPATGPVQTVWYAGAGNLLLAQTTSNRVFETSDFQHWRLNTTDVAPPQSGLKLQQVGARIYAARTDNIYASDDNGRSWLNLTGYNSQSVVGGGFSSVAVSPSNGNELTAANQFGVWRSLDGGLSWRGLNDELPNLRARRLLDRRTVVLADASVIRSDAAGVWMPIAGADPEVALRQNVARRSGWQLSSVAQASAILYGGTADGRLASSRDGGTTWTEAPRVTTSSIDRLWVDPERPESALAAAGNQLLRTVNGGLFWDDVTGSLPPASVHGITADRSSGVAYVATDRGVFAGNVPLNDAGAAASEWRSLSADLPPAPAWDVRLNADNTLTVALDGYGVFESPAPHRTRNVRLVNGADLSDRAAAPGSLISVLGANVRQGMAGGAQYPVLAASDQSSQLQVPFEASPGLLQIALQGVNDRWSVPLTVKDASPSIFVDTEGAPLILDSSSGVVVDNSVGVHAGSSVQVLATGLGKVSPDWPTGVPAPLESPPAVRAPVTAFIDGSSVEVTRATLAPGYVGYYLVELRIPAIVNRGTSELRIVVNGEESNRVKLYLEADRAAP
jgi:uncharacterized protein (TIGR03437 family)